jgi:hypothetical protein
MSKDKFYAISAFLAMFFVIILVAPCYAEITFEDWVGQWYKGNIKDKGLVVNPTGTGKLSEKLLTYGYVEDWNPVDKTYRSILIQSDDGGETWMDPVPYVVKVISGTPLDYVSYALIGPGVAPEVEMLAVILNVKGKEKNGFIKNANIKSVGGCVIYDLGGGSAYFAAEESLKMKVIPESKVPDEVKNKLP